MNEVNTVGASKFEPVRSGAASSASANEQAKANQSEEPATPVKGKVEVVEREAVQSSHGERQQNVKEAVAQMNEYIQESQRDLHFSYDADSGDTVVQVLDRNTQEVIRQIPDEIFLKLANQIDSGGPIQLFSAQA